MDLKECSLCGVSGEEKKIFSAISTKEIINVCEVCCKKENFPVLKRPTTEQLKKSEERVFDRKKFILDKKKEKQESFLNKIPEKKFETKKINKDLTPELVQDFHWIIMRARRFRKISQEQLAKEISESLSAIKMIEKGILPENYPILVSKIESFFKIKLLKKEFILNQQPIKKEPSRIISFDKKALENLTIDDLKKMNEMKKKQEQVDFSDEKSEFSSEDFLFQEE